MRSRIGFALVLVACLAAFQPRRGHAEAFDRSQAFRFLQQATFGPTQAELNRLADYAKTSDPLARWIDEQMALPPSLLLPTLQAQHASGVIKPKPLHEIRQNTWLRTVVVGRDQLRQRVAFALSELMVVSQRGPLFEMPLALGSYYDMLSRSAFGNYRQLLEDVTLHPAMGKYLSMLGNRKPDGLHNIRPDENYARELLQLFSIGLVQLNSDGSPRIDGAGALLPTYDQSVAEGFAHAFTGWNYTNAVSFSEAQRTTKTQVMPMKAYDEQHSLVSKRLLDYSGALHSQLPPGQSATQDLEDALDNVFYHPNVAPFVSLHLIRRLVTSNPSPAYVARVSSVFENDGNGRRGELAAVIRAILLDPEARPHLDATTEVTGKIKEPLLRLTQLWRAYDARSQGGTYVFLDADLRFGQGHLLSPSVFNFFRPDYSPQGEFADFGLVAPEMHIGNEGLNTLVTNYFYTQIFLQNSTISGLGGKKIVINIASEVAVASNPDLLVTRLAEKLFGSDISPALADEARAAVLRWPATNRGNRVAEAMFILVTSPQFAVQR